MKLVDLPEYCDNYMISLFKKKKCFVYTEAGFFGSLKSVGHNCEASSSRETILIWPKSDKNVSNQKMYLRNKMNITQRKKTIYEINCLVQKILIWLW